jgi:tellurite resistance protein TerC
MQLTPGVVMMQKVAHITYKTARRIAVLAVGSTVVALGVIMLVTPGPGLIVIPVGLAILGLEFAWARVWLRKVREGISNQNSRNHAERAERHRERVRR